jgi:hypothetical protein
MFQGAIRGHTQLKRGKLRGVEVEGNDPGRGVREKG